MAGALANHLAFMRRCQRLAAEGVRARDAASTLKRHPFYVEKVFAQAANFSEDEFAPPSSGSRSSTTHSRAAASSRPTSSSSGPWSTSAPRASGGGAGGEPGGPRLLTPGGVLVQSAVRRGLVDRAVSSRYSPRRHPGRPRDRGLEPLRERLHGRAVAEVLQPLALGGPDPLFLLSECWPSRRKARTRRAGED